MLSLPKHDTYVIRLVLKLRILKKSVMLNAVKHLYRFSQTPSNEAVEILRQAQHDNK
jgi:hypothetical protein